MPDISKLPELAEIFHISVDELLIVKGKVTLVGAVLDDTIAAYIEEGKATEQEIADTLPILKPEQAKKILEKADVSQFHDISSFLPFMDEEDVARLTVKALERGDSIGGYLPFVDEDTVNKLAIKALERGDSIYEYLPFMDKDDVTQLALKILRSKKK